MGAELLKRPAKLAKLVHGIVLASPLPVTVKIRSGESEARINAARVVELLQSAGAAAVTIHGRTKEQRCVTWELGL
jgi:tRNA-dihydrouridine synthase 3